MFLTDIGHNQLEHLIALRSDVELIVVKLLGIETIDYAHVGLLFDDGQCKCGLLRSITSSHQQHKYRLPGRQNGAAVLGECGVSSVGWPARMDTAHTGLANLPAKLLFYALIDAIVETFELCLD